MKTHCGKAVSWVAAAALLLVASAAVQAVARDALRAAAPAGAGAAIAPQQQHVRTPRTLQISPRIGPPGTRVTVASDRMPALTPVQLALGATTGFEALAFARTSIDGTLDESVVVPSWSESDETQRFLVFNVYFTSVLAESAIFHLTDAEGGVVREGVIQSAGPDCLVLEGDDGERYHLTGSSQGLDVGSRQTLAGTLSEAAETCGDDLSLALALAARD